MLRFICFWDRNFKDRRFAAMIKRRKIADGGIAARAQLIAHGPEAIRLRRRDLFDGALPAIKVVD